MTIGTVKFFNQAKRFGFITPDDGSKDVFVHISAVERSGLGYLSEGQKVGFVGGQLFAGIAGRLGMEGRDAALRVAGDKGHSRLSWGGAARVGPRALTLREQTVAAQLGLGPRP